MVETRLGHVVARVHEPGKMYLGVEHSTTNRINGYVLVGLADSIRAAINGGQKNPTIERHAISEDTLRRHAKNKQ
jgi:hypothetical protein